MSNDQLTLTQLADKMTGNVNNLSEEINWKLKKLRAKDNESYSKFEKKLKKSKKEIPLLANFENHEINEFIYQTFKLETG